MDHIAIFDCAIKRPSLICFNRLVTHLKTPFTYHRPSTEGLSSVRNDRSAKAFIIFGSASNVEDRLDWHKELSEFCRQRLEEDKPVLGLCFGHQLMADSFGMKVTRNIDNKCYYGTRKIKFAHAFGAHKTGDTKSVFKAHSFQVSGELKELEILATSDECLYDGLYHPKLPYWGFQGHPEASQDFYQHEIAVNDVNLKEVELQAALNDGLSLLKTFCQGL